MNFYRSFVDLNDATMYKYHATLKAAHDQAKLHNNRGDTRIESVEVPTDKDAVLTLLNGYKDSDFVVLRTWELTPRGGLHEVANGE